MSEEQITPDAPQPEQTREQELLEQLQRLQAEFANYRRRVEQTNERTKDAGLEAAIKKLLPVIDAMDLALPHAKENPEELAKGFTILYSQLQTILAEWDVKKIPGSGPVDPQLHEVYLTETSKTVPEGAVTRVLQNGYTRSGSVLRTAKVAAAKQE